MANMQTVKVSQEVFDRLQAWQKTLSEDAAKSSGAAPRMVLPTLGSIIELALNSFEKERAGR